MVDLTIRLVICQFFYNGRWLKGYVITNGGVMRFKLLSQLVKKILVLPALLVISISAANADCSLDLGMTSNIGRYTISSTCFTDSNWGLPVPDSNGNLTTSTSYDYKSNTYYNNWGIRHAAVDIVGPTSSPFTTDTYALI